MNTRQLWNLHHQRHKFHLGHLGTFGKWESRKWRFQEAFFTAYSTLFRQNTRKTGNNAVKISQAFQDIARFEHFTDLNLLKYAFDVIQNWEMDALQFYPMALSFC